MSETFPFHPVVIELGRELREHEGQFSLSAARCRHWEQMLTRRHDDERKTVSEHLIVLARTLIQQYAERSDVAVAQFAWLVGAMAGSHAHGVQAFERAGVPVPRIPHVHVSESTPQTPSTTDGTETLRSLLLDN